jgi:hypothetical protein
VKTSHSASLWSLRETSAECLLRLRGRKLYAEGFPEQPPTVELAVLPRASPSRATTLHHF